MKMQGKSRRLPTRGQESFWEPSGDKHGKKREKGSRWEKLDGGLVMTVKNTKSQHLNMLMISRAGAWLEQTQGMGCGGTQEQTSAPIWSKNQIKYSKYKSKISGQKTDSCLQGLLWKWGWVMNYGWGNKEVSRGGAFWGDPYECPECKWILLHICIMVSSAFTACSQYSCRQLLASHTATPAHCAELPNGKLLRLRHVNISLLQRTSTYSFCCGFQIQQRSCLTPACCLIFTLIICNKSFLGLC